MPLRPALLLSIALFIVSRISLAQTHEHEAVETLGTVSFETSCSASTRAPFDRAVALMHSFQFGQAIDAFQAVLAGDPSCAMAYWGIALSRWGNPFAPGGKSPAQLAQGFDAVAQARAASTKNDRERLYIEAVASLYTDSDRIDQRTRALAYEHAMGAVAARYADDTEAQIFYALSLAAAADPADKTFAKQLKAGAILESLFVALPNHPGLAHYIIHAYDVPPLAGRAADAARRYSQIAPSTPHALHMPSHTFTRLGDWPASIEANRASAAAARAAGQPADELHASDYLIYAYLQTGQDQAAARLLDTASQALQHFDPAAPTAASGAAPAYFASAAIPARFSLERHAWTEAAALQPHPSPLPYADAMSYFAIGLGAAHLRDAATARTAIEALGRIHDGLAAAQERYWADQVEIQRLEVVAWLALTEGHSAVALAGLRRVADMEEATEKNAVTPGPLAPARELLGDMLLQLKRPAPALREYENALRREPNRFWSLYGAAEAAKLAGDRARARRYFQRLLAAAALTDQPGRAQLLEARTEIAR